MKVFILLLSLNILLVPIAGLKVLGVFPTISTSHFAIGHAIVKSLHDVGHEITVISPYQLKKPLKNYRDISIADTLEESRKSNFNKIKF